MNTKTKPKARITSVSVSRLYNLGNYQNVKYDLTAEVPEGASAKDTLCQLYHIVKLLAPLHRPECYERFKNAVGRLASDQSEFEKDHLPGWRTEVEKFESMKAMREEAVKSLDALGATSLRKDGKTTWDDDDDTPY